MPNGQLQLLLRQIRRIADPGRTAAVSDACLLESFVTRRDEAAFELLLWRHGAMVLNLCRRLLRREQDAEDAFQATFLTLVSKAAAITKRASLASWLYKVAYRIALTARAWDASVRPLPQALAERLASTDSGQLPDYDLGLVLDQEVNRLPEKYRAPFVLCYLQGKTNEEAARALGCPKGTVLSRLARARERLRWRLSRRGLALSAGLLGAAASDRAMSATLLDHTVKSALLIGSENMAAAVINARVAALMEGVMRTMFLTKVKCLAALLLVLGLVGSGAGLLSYGTSAAGAADHANGQPDIKQGIVPEGVPDGRPYEPRIVTEQSANQESQRDRAISRLHLKCIGLAMHSYHETHGHLPAPAIYDRNGKPLLSWRVALLPYLEEQELYRLFHVDEPWDSPHNKRLLGQLPKVYQPAPDQGWAFSPSTLCQVFVGPGTAFERGKYFAGRAQGFELPSIRFSSFTDGTANTFLVVEAEKSVEWTKPQDLSYDPLGPLPALGSQLRDDFQAVFADGAVYTIDKKADPRLIRAAITRNGGEPFDREKLTGPQIGQSRVRQSSNARERNQQLKEQLAQAQVQLAALRDELEREKERRQHNAETLKLEHENARLEEELTNLQDQIKTAAAELQKFKKRLR
jgi:RNA polymerase sigma factor (sigma-70 family)